MEKPRFTPGGPPGPGRPKGSRNKLAEDFLAKLHADFQEHGAVAIARTREEKPADYVRIVAGLLPQKVEIDRVTRDMTDEELLAIIRAGSGAGASDAPAHQEGPDGLVH